MRRASFIAIVATLWSCASSAAESIVIGGKIFTESYILGEMAAQTIESSSEVPVNRKVGMGSTGILFEGLKNGAIDLYPDYTGTLAEAILKRPELKSLDEIRQALSGMGLTMSGSLGFNDTYALAVKEDFAEKYGLHSLGDLIPIQSAVRQAFSYEIMDLNDPSPGMDSKLPLAFNL